MKEVTFVKDVQYLIKKHLYKTGKSVFGGFDKKIKCTETYNEKKSF